MTVTVLSGGKEMTQFHTFNFCLPPPPFGVLKSLLIILHTLKVMWLLWQQEMIKQRNCLQKSLAIFLRPPSLTELWLERKRYHCISWITRLRPSTTALLLVYKRRKRLLSCNKPFLSNLSAFQGWGEEEKKTQIRHRTLCADYNGNHITEGCLQRL